MELKIGEIMRKAATILVTATVGIFIGLYLNPLISGNNIYQQFKKFEFVFNTALKNYVEEVDSDKMMEAAIDGMLGHLDVHSVYINEDDMKKVQEDFQGSFEGIGIEFDILNDTVTVISPIAGGPSESLGIQAGDKIIKIDGEDAVGIERSEVPKRLKGPKGTLVEVDILRGTNPKPIHYNITRDKIPLYSLDASYKVDGADIGVISISRFAATTHEELITAVDKLKREGVQKLILDLRGNPGGYLQQAFLMADEFIPGNNMIVYTDGRRPEFNEEFFSTPGGRLEDIPLIVMINAGSASASEIVSGAIQDLDRGLVVGTTSFGKGLVQRQYPLGDGSAIRLTISKYYTPSGRSIQRPYKDSDQYRHLVGRLELEEGSNIEQSIEAIKKKAKNSDEINLDSLPIYRTKSGRMVLGGGGITPDYIVIHDTTRLTDLTADFRRTRVFYDFANNYLASEGDYIKAKYTGDFISFLRNYDVTDEELEKFRSFALPKVAEEEKDKDSTTIQEQFEKDEEFIKLWLKSTFARLIWDREKQIQVLSVVDRQLQRALSLFPEAEKISKLN